MLAMATQSKDSAIIIVSFSLSLLALVKTTRILNYSVYCHIGPTGYQSWTDSNVGDRTDLRDTASNSWPVFYHRPLALSSSPCSVIVPLLCHRPLTLSSSPCSVIVPFLCHRPLALSSFLSSSPCCVIVLLLCHRFCHRPPAVIVPLFCHRPPVLLSSACL